MTIAGNLSETDVQRIEQCCDPSLRKIRDLIYKVAGIYLTEDKILFLQERVQRRMKERDLSQLPDYYDLLTIKQDRDTELRELLNEIADGETRLFRCIPHLDALRNSLLPELTQVKSHMMQRKLRVWCAGCSTGEEAYTLAMVLTDEMSTKYPGWRFDLIATDLNERALALAKEGVYAEEEMQKTPAYFRKEYFQSTGAGMAVKPEIKRCVSFRLLNLVDDNKMMFMKGMNIISCCNVMIHFNVESKRRVVHHFYSNLLPGGYLFLGESESLHGIPNEFRLVHFPQVTTYFRPPAPAFPGMKP